ncbi:Protein of unknown function DUF247, plant [Dillenia turbinata]|uniref:Uncharacterized protein n=1 Tax=Dillenia turbinata TaxID=194707 RepID=A0AAN8W313_9MAGN
MKNRIEETKKSFSFMERKRKQYAASPMLQEQSSQEYKITSIMKARKNIVPALLRDVDKEAYTPKIISIEPFHHNRAELKSVEVQKRRLLDRMIEIVCITEQELTMIENKFEVDDPIFITHWLLPFIRLKADHPHLLGLFQSGFLPLNESKDYPLTSQKSETPQKRWLMEAKLLTEAGIKLRTGSGHLLDIKFKKNVLEIPTIQVYYNTNFVVRNMVAYGRCDRSARPFFTCLVVFYNSLVDTYEDVCILREAAATSSPPSSLSQLFQRGLNMEASSKSIASSIPNAIDVNLCLSCTCIYVPVICELARCNERDIAKSWKAVRFAKRPRIHTFIANSYAAQIEDDQGADAGRSDRQFLYQILGEVIKEGATTLNIPDTIGCDHFDPQPKQSWDSQHHSGDMNSCMTSRGYHQRHWGKGWQCFFGRGCDDIKVSQGADIRRSLHRQIILSISPLPTKRLRISMHKSEQEWRKESEGNRGKTLHRCIKDQSPQECAINASYAGRKKHDFMKTWTIFAVPPLLCDADNEVSTPEMVSIGPFHCNLPEMKSMETQNCRLMDRMLEKVEITEQLIDAAEELEDRTKECYYEELKETSNDFARMMVPDGGFLVELLLLNYKMIENKYQIDDPIFATHWMVPSIQHGLLMLENQIPLFVPQEIFDLTKTRHDKVSLDRIALEFFKLIRPGNRKVYNSERSDYPRKGWLNKAKLLQEAAVKIRSKIGHIVGHKVSRKKSWKFLLYVYTTTLACLSEIWRHMNNATGCLAAYEQCNRSAHPFFTCLVIFYDSLVDTSEDHSQGSDGNVMTMVSGLCRGVIYDELNSYYSGGPMDKLYNFCWSRYRKLRIKVVRDYAPPMLFYLALVQTNFCLEVMVRASQPLSKSLNVCLFIDKVIVVCFEDLTHKMTDFPDYISTKLVDVLSKLRSTGKCITDNAICLFNRPILQSDSFCLHSVHVH